jgi:DNA primase
LNRNEAREYVKSQLLPYLQSHYGVALNPKKFFRCLDPGHLIDKTPSMHYDSRHERAVCFSCGKSYDIFDLIEIETGLSGNALFLYAYSMFGLDVEKDPAKPSAAPVAARLPAKSEASKKDYSKFYRFAQSRLPMTGYHLARGISEDVAARFMLGFVPGYKSMEEGKESVWDALIIPVRTYCYTARNISPSSKSARYRKIGGNEIYHAKALGSGRPVFAVEGEIDALSVITAGHEALALGTLSNTGRLFSHVMAAKPTQPIILALDNEPGAGQKAQELLELLLREGIGAFLADKFPGGKDANESLLADSEAFSEWLDEMESKARK